MYRTLSGWATDTYSRILHRHPNWPLPGRNALHAVPLKLFAAPVWIRLGSSDTSVLSEIAQYHEYDWIFPELKAPIRTVIDLGGNCGITMRLWAERFASLKQLFIIEPDKDNIRVLRRNAESLTHRTQLIKACIVATHRPIRLERGKSATAFTMKNGTDGETIATITMEDLLGQIPQNDSIDLLKCDIEGAEQELFANCSSWLYRVRNMVVEVHGEYTTAHLRQAVSAAQGSYRRILESPYRTGVIGFFSS